MPRIPHRNRDLRKWVVWNSCLRAVGFVVWCTLFYLGAWSYNQNHQTYPPERLILGWKLLVLMGIALISGLLVFRIWRLFTLRPLSGTVERYSNSRGYSASDDSGAIGGHYDFRIYTVLHVRTESGAIRRIRFEEKNGFRQYYHEGERIVRLRGLPYPVNADTSAEKGCVCALCGTFSEKPTETCAVCNRSIVDPRELF